MLTPPSSTAVTTSSTKPCPLSARALASRAVRTTPASAERTPESTNRVVLSRATRTPANRAASWFFPVANSTRPTQVRCSTKANTTTSPAKTQKGQGTSVPGTTPNPKSLNAAGQLLIDRGPRTT